MPGNKRPFALSPAYIEEIHDKLVLISFPGSEPVGTARNRALLESASLRPFQTAYGRDIFPTLIEKAAALFHGLIADHPFENGCKRTAVIAADLFLLANWQFLALSKEEAYELAKCTAVANVNGWTVKDTLGWLTDKLSTRLIDLPSMFKGGYVIMASFAALMAISIRRDKLNSHQPAPRDNTGA